MSEEIKDATQAMDIASKAVQKAGIMFSFINSAKKENAYWIVEVVTFTGRYIVRINASTGEVVEFRPVT
jgi:uncharacterized membrane protein YkoI